MAKRIQVGGRIESKEVGGIVTGAAEILDDAKGKKQSVINGETDDELVRLDQSKQNNLTFDNAPTEGSDNPVKSGGVYAADKALSDAIEAILLLIPSAASALNKLVDTAMMNSSISTATATFRGTYNVVTDLELAVDATHEQIAAKLAQVVSEADNNDYTFVQVPVSAESTDIRRTERYKFNGTAWGYEYDLNTSGFTAAQWAAINSGITLALVGKLIGLPTSSEIQALLGQKQDILTFDNVPTAGSANPVKSGGVYSAINDEKTAREQLAQTVTGINGRVGNVEEVIPTGAAANNKLVANNSLEAYVTSIIDAITASFTIATADGHINLTLTQTNGRVASLTMTSSDIASAQALTALTGRVSTAEDNITTLGGRVSTNETDIANLQQLYNDLQQSKPVPVTALPSTGQQHGVIYRLAGTTSYSDYMWNGSTWVLMATYNNAIDPRPKKASQNLVTSGGVFDNMGALDVSELNATENPHTLAQYVDLSAALAAVPTDYQKGGMSIKFVQSSDNKYERYNLLADSFTTDVTKWAIDDVGVYVENPEFISVETDNEDRILGGRKADGTKFENMPVEIPAVVTSGIDDPDGRIDIKTDKDGRIISYRDKDGILHECCGIEVKNLIHNPDDIIGLNDPMNMPYILANLKNPTSTTGYSIRSNPLVFLHMTDIHGNKMNFDRMLEFRNAYKQYIDDSIISGDLVTNSFSDDFSFYSGNADAKDILLCIGNHDSASFDGTSFDWTAHVGSDCYNKFIKDFIGNWNANYQPNICYYYKDYSDYEIRLIVLDNMEYVKNGANSDQIEWFENVLSSAKSLGYAVVCVSHYPYNITAFECPFETRKSKTMNANQTVWIEKVQDFIDDGGDFICWINGHEHRDHLGIVSDTHQLSITLDTAALGSQAAYSDVARTQGDKSQDLFNLVSIDPVFKVIKILRIGADRDMWMRHKDSISIQYASNSEYELEDSMPQIIK